MRDKTPEKPIPLPKYTGVLDTYDKYNYDYGEREGASKKVDLQERQPPPENRAWERSNSS